MMSTEELIQNPYKMDDRHQVEYFEHLYYDMAHDKREKIDVADYEEDYQRYWALKELRRTNFHYFFSFFGLVAFIIGFAEFSNGGYVLTAANGIFFLGSLVLFTLSVIVYTAHLRHERELLNYRHKRIIEEIE